MERRFDDDNRLTQTHRNYDQPAADASERGNCFQASKQITRRSSETRLTSARSLWVGHCSHFPPGAGRKWVPRFALARVRRPRRGKKTTWSRLRSEKQLFPTLLPYGRQIWVLFPSFVAIWMCVSVPRKVERGDRGEQCTCESEIYFGVIISFFCWDIAFVAMAQPWGQIFAS